MVLENLDQKGREETIRLCLFLWEYLVVLYGIFSERFFGRKKFHLLPGPARIDEVDKVNSDVRECLDMAASC